MLTKEEIEARRLMALAKELEANQRGVWWMSFCDMSKPQGQQWLGVIVVEELGPMHAVNKTHELGINPGGDIAFARVQPGVVKPEHMDRLLSRAELREFGYIEDRRN